MAVTRRRLGERVKATLLRTFKVDAINEREAPESGLWLRQERPLGREQSSYRAPSLLLKSPDMGCLLVADKLPSMGRLSEYPSDDFIGV